MKPFDIEEVRKGARVCTADGRDVKIITTELKNPCPVVGVVSYTNYEGDYCEGILQTMTDGKYPWIGQDTSQDLMLWESILDNSIWDLTNSEREILKCYLKGYPNLTYRTNKKYVIFTVDGKEIYKFKRDISE